MKKTIMTADDSASARQMIRFSLEAAGYNVVEAADSEEALSLLEIEKVDMLITDLSMPGMNGIELTEKIRFHPKLRYLPVILLTTESRKDIKQNGKLAGVTGWIVKPFTPDQLVNVVKRVLK